MVTLRTPTTIQPWYVQSFVCCHAWRCRQSFGCNRTILGRGVFALLPRVVWSRMHLCAYSSNVFCVRHSAATAFPQGTLYNIVILLQEIRVVQVTGECDADMDTCVRLKHLVQYFGVVSGTAAITAFQ